MTNLDFVLITLNTNIETNAAIHSSQFDSVGRNGHLLAAPPTVGLAKHSHINIIFPAWKDRRLRPTLRTEI